MNDEVIQAIIASKPALKSAGDKLRAMQPGAYCIHRSWGFGQINSYDEVQGKLIIDFDEKPAHLMDPAFCVDKLDILPAENILVRQRTEPDLIQELIKKKPTDLIVEILSHCSDQAASTAEIENLLRRLLGDTVYKRWWTKTKKLLVKDPRIAVPSRKTDPYILRDEPMKPEHEILEEFYFTKKPLKKIALAEKLHELSDNVDEIRQDLPQILETITEAIKGTRSLTQAQRLHGMWVRNDLARHLEKEKLLEEQGGEESENFAELVEEKVDSLEPTSKSLVRETEDLSELAENLPGAYHKRFLDLITRVYPDEWRTIILNLLRNSSGKLTQECISFMYDRKESDLVADSFQKWLNEQSLKGPVLYWIAKNRNSRKFSKLVKDMIGTRLFAAIFYAIDNEALQATSNRRIPLADILSDDVELIPDLLGNADQESARDLAQTLLLNQGFENLTKKSLLARFIKQFPRIQSLVEGDTQKQSEAFIVSQASFDARKEEYEHLVNVLIPKNKEDIAIAREHGDLKENSEYKMARQDQDTLMARRAQLEVDLERARVTDFTEATVDTVGIGNIVSLNNSATGNTTRYAILGAWDSNPEANIISYKTPLGQNLLGKTAGEKVKLEIGGKSTEWAIEGVKLWKEEAATWKS